jgi:hypothetical protein
MQSSSHACYMPCPSHTPWLDCSNYTRRGVQVVKLLIIQFSLPFHYFIPLWSKYSPQHPVLKHPQSAFFSWCHETNFKPIQNHRQNYSFLYSNSYVFRQLKRRQKVQNRMAASITWTQSALNFLLNQISIRYCRSHVSELCHIYVGSCECLYVMILSCIMLTRHQQYFIYKYT